MLLMRNKWMDGWIMRSKGDNLRKISSLVTWCYPWIKIKRTTKETLDTRRGRLAEDHYQ